MSTPDPRASPTSLVLVEHLSGERLRTYLAACDGSLDEAIALYAWNSQVTGAFWEHLGHVEVALRNTLDARLTARHDRSGRTGTWLDDPARELTERARKDIATARARVKAKGKAAIHGQVLSELSFGFWRFLVSKTYSGRFWPDLASGFPHAPNRALTTIETPVRELHVFRNRLAHHQRIWSEPLEKRHRDLEDLAGYINPTLAAWMTSTSRVPATLASRP